MAPLHLATTTLTKLGDGAIIDLTDDVVRIDLSPAADPEITIDLRDPNPYTAGYFRSDAERARLEQQIIELSTPSVDANSGLVYVLIDGRSPLSDWTRTVEMALGWGDMPTYMNGYEHASIAGAVIDHDRPGGPAITHGGRLFRGHLAPPFSCGSQVVDSVPGMDPDAVAAWLGISSLRQCWDATTFITRPDLPRSDRFPKGYAVLNLMMVTRHVMTFGVPQFNCYFNELSQRALGRAGVQIHAFFDAEYRAPLVDGYEYNTEFAAGFVPIAEFADAFFSDESPHAPTSRPIRELSVPIVEVVHGV